jgi:hypothetical protein
MSKRSRRLLGPALWAVLAGFSVLVFGVDPVSAAGRQSAADARKEKAARKACLTGDYSTGIAILSDLFVEKKDPIYVFNQGRCLEQNSQFKEAIARFEEYLRMGETSELKRADRASAEKHIEDCRSRLSKEEAVAPPPLPQPLPQTFVPPTPQPATAPIVGRARSQAEAPSSGKGLLIGGIVTGSIGVVVAGAGLYFNLTANSMVNEMQTKVDGFTSSKNSKQKTYKTLGWVGYGVGAACVTTGVILIAIGASGPSSPTQAQVALVPVVGSGQAGVLLQGGF